MAHGTRAQAGTLAEPVFPDKQPEVSLTEAEAVTLLAVGELSRRQVRQELTDEVVNNPGSVAHYLALRFGKEDQEGMGALFVDICSRVKAEVKSFVGR